MSSFFSLYRRGLVSMVTGPVLVAAGLVAGVRLVVLAGLVVLVWGGYRLFAARKADR